MKHFSQGNVPLSPCTFSCRIQSQADPNVFWQTPHETAYAFPDQFGFSITYGTRDIRTGCQDAHCMSSRGAFVNFSSFFTAIPTSVLAGFLLFRDQYYLSSVSRFLTSTATSNSDYGFHSIITFRSMYIFFSILDGIIIIHGIPCT